MDRFLYQFELIANEETYWNSSLGRHSVAIDVVVKVIGLQWRLVDLYLALAYINKNR
jgi:hypothetical protein